MNGFRRSRRLTVGQLDVVGIDQVCLAKYDASLYDILQLSYVSRPLIELKLFHGLFAESDIGGRIISSEKMLDKTRDIFLAVFEWW